MKVWSLLDLYIWLERMLLFAENPHVAANIFKSSENVNIETVLGIKKDGKKVSFLDNYDK